MCGEDAILQIFFDSKKSARRPLGVARARWGSFQRPWGVMTCLMLLTWDLNDGNDHSSIRVANISAL